jgi:hypothetical protein
MVWISVNLMKLGGAEVEAYLLVVGDIIHPISVVGESNVTVTASNAE